MAKRGYWMALILSVLLCGCGWTEGSYVSVTPHQQQEGHFPVQALAARNARELQTVLEGMIDSGTESAVINVAEYDRDVQEDLDRMVPQLRSSHALAAYAVENIVCEVGANTGKPAVAVQIAYRRSALEIQRIRRAVDMTAAGRLITAALDGCQAGQVLLVEDYREQDLSQLVQDHAQAHPETVMEVPQVGVSVYGTGKQRVVEVTFGYQNSREALRQMQNLVAPVFDSAVLYVSGEGSAMQKLGQLYGFLMERFSYSLRTSITPGYSLLCHGVGDSRAFAEVYAAMCRQAGLECLIVTGTRQGEPWTWNMIRGEEQYYHLDLLRCSQLGGFRTFTDGEMTDYVWDYSAYPVSAVPYTPPTEPEETEPELTQPPQTEEPEQTLPQTTEPEEPTEEKT